MSVLVLGGDSIFRFGSVTAEKHSTAQLSSHRASAACACMSLSRLGSPLAQAQC